MPVGDGDRVPTTVSAMAAAPPEPDLAATSSTPSWGLGEVVLGWLLAMVLAAVVTAVAVSALGYSLSAPTGTGSSVGQVSRDLAEGVPPSVDKPVPIELSALLQIPLWVGLLGIPYLACRYKGRGIVADLRLRMRWIDIPIGLAAGIGTQLLLIPAMYWLLFQVIGDRDVSEEARQLTDRATGPLGVAVLIAIVGIGAPIAEEIFFRGFANTALEKRGMPWMAAIAITAFFFALTHFQPLQFPALFLFGVILGLLVHWKGRLGPAIWAHVGFNVVAAVVLVVS